MFIARRCRPILLLSLLSLALPGCDRPRERGPIEVGVIDDAADRTPAPDITRPDRFAATLRSATGQGLVRFDAAGQVVPGLAARWIVTGGGRSLIFRLPDLPPPGRRPIDAERIVRVIRAAIAPDSRNPLKPLLGAIGDVDAVTPQVIDIELSAPRPNMLQLLAQPALGIDEEQGGPFAIVARRASAAILKPLPDPDADPDAAHAPPALVHVEARSAGRSVARFLAGRAALVLGGDFDNLPVARVAALPADLLRFDPTNGLFGFAFARADQGFTADPAVRRALAMAIDRDRIAASLAVPGWTGATGIVAAGTPEIAAPYRPDWSGEPLAQRRAEARGVVAEWIAQHGSGPAVAPILRVAMPAGPGGRLLFAQVAADWRAIGVSAMPAAPGGPADLQWIDEVAPADVASFYLRRFACDRQIPCTPLADQILIDARDTPSLTERAVLLTQADALIGQITPFIALGSPIRWSLVSPDLYLYRESPRAIHPLNELRSPLAR